MDHCFIISGPPYTSAIFIFYLCFILLLSLISSFSSLMFPSSFLISLLSLLFFIFYSCFVSSSSFSLSSFSPPLFFFSFFYFFFSLCCCCFSSEHLRTINRKPGSLKIFSYSQTFPTPPFEQLEEWEKTFVASPTPGCPLIRRQDMLLMTQVFLHHSFFHLRRTSSPSQAALCYGRPSS